MPRKNQNRIAEQELPEIKDSVRVCRVGVARGGSQFEVWDGEKTWLAELPKRFRNTVWVRRGSHVLVGGAENSEKGEIIFVLQKDHIAELKTRGVWPPSLDEQETQQSLTEAQSPNEGSEEITGSDDGTGDSDSELFQNPNRR